MQESTSQLYKDLCSIHRKNNELNELLDSQSLKLSLDIDLKIIETEICDIDQWIPEHKLSDEYNIPHTKGSMVYVKKFTYSCAFNSGKYSQHGITTYGHGDNAKDIFDKLLQIAYKHGLRLVSPFRVGTIVRFLYTKYKHNAFVAFEFPNKEEFLHKLENIRAVEVPLNIPNEYDEDEKKTCSCDSLKLDIQSMKETLCRDILKNANTINYSYYDVLPNLKQQDQTITKIEQEIDLLSFMKQNNRKNQESKPIENNNNKNTEANNNEISDIESSDESWYGEHYDAR